jgi:phenylacetate-CoA ligase
MSHKLLKLYHLLPPALRSAAATLRGLQLNHARHGPGGQALEDAVAERDYWSPAQWSAWREQRLAYILHRAATRVPYYRRYWENQRRRGAGLAPEQLEHWPVLEKESVRQNPRAFLADDVNPRFLISEQTSGTTGTPLETWRSHETLAAHYAIKTVRTRGWDGIPPGTRWARLGGQIVVPIKRRRPPFWVWNASMQQLYLSTYHLAPDLVPYYLDALAHYRVKYLAGYPSALQALAYEVVRLGRRDLRMWAVYANAEPVLPQQRELIAQAFQCPIRESYGMTEGVAAGSECAHGRLHQWPEFGVTEVAADAATGGDLVCTGLLNAAMILVRYRVGDRSHVTDNATPCLCGRTLPALGPIDGRTQDMVLTPDGRQAMRMETVFYGLPIRQSQIVQQRLDALLVRVAASPEFTGGHEQEIVLRLRERLGDVRVDIERVPELPRSANGKIRAVISTLTASDRSAALLRGLAGAPTV